MSKNFGFFVLTLYLAALLQVSILALPIGILIIMVWYLANDGRHLIILTLLFCLFLSSVSNIQLSYILLATTISLAIFVTGRDYLPHRFTVTTGLAVFGVIAWEVSLFILVGLKI